MADSKHAGSAGQKGDLSERELQERLKEGPPEGLIDQVGENRNLTGSTTYETLDERENDENRQTARKGQAQSPREQTPNPPHTTTGKVTSPKFGSAGSGGAELEPGPERD